MTHRDRLQNTIVYDILELLDKDMPVGFLEVQTGTGKTKILLDAAIEIQRQNRPVIISTSNNFLAESFLHEAQKFNILPEKIEFIVGKNNYINEKVLLSDEFLYEFSLDKEDVIEWMNQHEGRELISLFARDFSLSDEAKNLLEPTDEDEPRSISDVLEKITDGGTVYITNHHYLIAMIRHAKTGMLDNAVILCDEVHMINNAAKSMFKNTFSPFRLKYMLFEVLKSDAVSKTKKRKIQKAIAWIESIMSEVEYKRKEIEGDMEKAASKIITKEWGDVSKEVIDTLSSIKSREAKSHVSASLKEAYEMKSIFSYTQKPGRNITEVSFSPAKGYPSFSVQGNNPISMLRGYISNHLFGFVGISGTIRVSESDTAEDNKWSFERVGFMPYKSPESESQILFNKRTKSIFFRAYPSVFSREQARYYIAEESRYLPPKTGSNTKVSQAMYERWVEELAMLCKDTVWGNTVVLMSSFENVEMMHEKLQGVDMDEKYRIVSHKVGTSMSAVINEYKANIDAGHKSILIGGLGFYTGIDMHGEYLHTLFLGKLPIEPSSFFTKMKFGSYSAQSDMRKNALLTFRQGIGRAIRTPDDKALIIVADPRIKNARYRVFKEFLDEYAVKVEK